MCECARARAYVAGMGGIMCVFNVCEHCDGDFGPISVSQVLTNFWGKEFWANFWSGKG